MISIPVLSILKWIFFIGFPAGFVLVVTCIIKGSRKGRQKQSYDWKPFDWRVQPEPEFDEKNGQRS